MLIPSRIFIFKLFLSVHRNVEFPLFPPIFREHRHSKIEMRNILGIPVSAKLIVISMGGIPLSINNLQIEVKDKNTYFVVPGTEVKTSIYKWSKYYTYLTTIHIFTLTSFMQVTW